MASTRMTKKDVSDAFAELRTDIRDYFNATHDELVSMYNKQFSAMSCPTHTDKLSREFIIKSLIVHSLFHAMETLKVD
jgi:hypothetical protein